MRIAGLWLALFATYSLLLSIPTVIGSRWNVGALLLAFFIATMVIIGAALSRALLNTSLFGSLIIATTALLILYDALLLSSAASTNFTAYSRGVATWVNGRPTPEGSLNRAWLSAAVVAINLLSYCGLRAALASARRLRDRLDACGSSS